eukprot:GILI01006353.1.p1 GENE.GILI01006353.1~~GILI01006353.1.p1  ORF type:complete len:390 (-),score=112.34 GILI01006353.1:122-1291(-)
MKPTDRPMSRGTADRPPTAPAPGPGVPFVAPLPPGPPPKNVERRWVAPGAGVPAPVPAGYPGGAPPLLSSPSSAAAPPAVSSPASRPAPGDDSRSSSAYFNEGEYERIKFLGRGASAICYLVRRTSDGGDCVVKQMCVPVEDMTAKQIKETQTEIRVLSRLAHPCIITYEKTFEEGGVLHIVTEYADGGTLSKRIQDELEAQEEGKPDAGFNEEEVFDWFAQLALALQYVHSKNILHRDVKSQNVFLTKDGLVKLGDFGVSRILSTNTNFASTVVGTPYYLPPELWSGKAYDGKSDVWSLGCILFELATLKKPFQGETMPALMFNVMRGKYKAELLANCSARVRTFVEMILVVDRNSRASLNDLITHELLVPYIQKWTTIFAQLQAKNS